MTTKQFSTSSSICGIVGVVLLISSFVVNPGPPPGLSLSELQAFGEAHHTAILIGAWLQAVSPPMIMIFALSVVHLGGTAARFLELVVLLGGSILCMVSLTEVVFYLNAVSSKSAWQASGSLNLIQATQHLFSMAAAPLVFLPLSIAILRSGVLPRVFGYTGLAIGVLFAVMGGIVLFRPWQFIVDDLAYLQGGWWMAAALTLLIRAQRMNEVSAASSPQK